MSDPVEKIFVGGHQGGGGRLQDLLAGGFFFVARGEGGGGGESQQALAGILRKQKFFRQGLAGQGQARTRPVVEGVDPPAPFVGAGEAVVE